MNHHPLLDGTRIQKPSRHKTFCLILSIAAIVSSVSLLTFQVINPKTSLDICHASYDRDLCLTMVNEELARNPSENINHVDLLKLSLRKSTSHVQDFIDVARNVSYRLNSAREEAGLNDCVELMELSKQRIMDSVDGDLDDDVHTWLSSVLTNHVTCFDGLDGLARSIMEVKLNDLISRARFNLAVFVAVSPTTQDDTLIKPLISFPSWVTTRDRKLLESNSATNHAINANLVVAKDGTGKYTTVKEAVDASPDNGGSRFVIYVKKGIYKENVEIGKTKKNLMITGDGMDSTIITGSLNVIDGSTTFKSATLIVGGDGFMAQDIGIQNTAGPQKHQAVALRVSADKSVINRCRIDAYQDTLYTHTLRQFYRDSYITGTVDFIFGDAAVVFQNCKLVARKPMANQANMVTAQGRTDPNQNTGTSIQQCSIIASSDLEPVKSSIKSYLGRPWKEYSRTVILQSSIGDHIDPTGWSPWAGDFALKTLYYGEYMNTGPGAGTSKRVNWPGFRVITSYAEAQKFTVAQLIQGGSWLTSTGVVYKEGL